MHEKTSRYVWTPQTIPELVRRKAPAGVIRLVAGCFGLADKTTGEFEVTKTWLAAMQGRCKRTVDRCMEWAVENGIIERVEVVRDGKQRANRYRLVRCEFWTLKAVQVAEAYRKLRDKLKAVAVAKRERLQLLHGDIFVRGGTTQELKQDDEAEIRSRLARKEQERRELEARFGFNREVRR